jgi:hypothetical protein
MGGGEHPSIVAFWNRLPLTIKSVSFGVRRGSKKRICEKRPHKIDHA